MEPISGMISGAAYPLSAAAKVQPPEDKTQGSPAVPVKDEYIPEKKQEPSGLYWLGRDEDGMPKVYFDDPERAADAPEKQTPDEKAESRTCNTDKVDREIERLKKKREELERQIQSETDNSKIEELERELAQTESELRQKDNDAYRRQHAVFS